MASPGLIELRIYDGDAPAVLLGTAAHTMQRQWQSVYNDVGLGRYVTHVDLAEFVERGNIVRCRFPEVSANDVFAWVIEKFPAQTLPADNNWGARLMNVSGRGVLALLDNAIVYPEGGVGTYSPDRRVFGWVSGSYDDAAWTPAVESRQANYKGAPWYGLPSDWPDPNAHWIWSRAGGETNVPAGICYFRKTFTLGADAQVRVFATGDGSITLYLDGELLADKPNTTNYAQTQQADRTLAAGDHILAACGNNIAGPASILVTVMSIDGSGALGAVAEHTDNSWVALDYPASVPGMTPGAILKVLIDEAQARGCLPGITQGFTPAADSNTVAWPSEMEVAFTVGSSVLQAARILVEQAIDIEMTPALVLKAYAAGTLGTDKTGTVSIAYQSNALETSHDDEPPQLTIALVHYHTGRWLEVDSGNTALYGRIEAPLETGTAPSEAAATAAAEAIFDEWAEDTDRITVRALWVAAKRPFFDWVVGDTINVIDRSLAPVATNILSLSVDESVSGEPIFVAEGAQ